MKRESVWSFVSCAVIGIIGLTATIAHANITFSSSSGNLAASVTFSTSGSNLIVTLTNTSTADVLVPSDVLTAVFFDLPGNPSLSSVSAVLGVGSSVINPPSGTGTDPGGVVGGEWAYASGLVSAPGGAKQGISSSGLGLFGNATFPGSELQGPLNSGAVDGVQYGITSAGDDPTTGNGGISGQGLIKNSVVFTLSGLPGGFNQSSLSTIGNVTLQYGTALGENPPSPVPAPAESLLVLIGLGMIGWTRWRALA